MNEGFIQFHVIKSVFPKLGGLGFKNLKVMKLAWKLNNTKEDLWCKVLKAKYSREEDWPSMATAKSANSFLWKNICKLWPLINECTTRSIGDGSMTKFWSDTWMETNCLKEISIPNLPPDMLEATVDSFVNHYGNWDISRLAEWLPQQQFLKLNAIPLSKCCE